MKIRHHASLWVLLLVCLGIIGLTVYVARPPEPPFDITDACKILQEYPDWYRASKKAAQRWGLPIASQLAIIYQESRFRADAKPLRDRLLKRVPWVRRSSAVGYAQVQDDTWERYKKATKNWQANRENYSDAVDFIGWYTHQAHREAGLSLSNTRDVYIAYHDGVTGYLKGKYRHELWLWHVANNVEHMAWRYQMQLSRCKLPK